MFVEAPADAADIAVNWGANDKMHFLSLSLSISLCGQVVYRAESESDSESGRLAVSIKLINNFMLLKQTAVPKREEHNKFFCVWNALYFFFGFCCNPLSDEAPQKALKEQSSNYHSIYLSFLCWLAKFNLTITKYSKLLTRNSWLSVLSSSAIAECNLFCLSIAQWIKLLNYPKPKH